MNESRKQFLEWFGEEFESINNSEELHAQAIKMIAWQSWVKSRAVIEINLPTELKLKKYACSDCIGFTLDEVENGLHAAGIKVKE